MLVFVGPCYFCLSLLLTTSTKLDIFIMRRCNKVDHMHVIKDGDGLTKDHMHVKYKRNYGHTCSLFGLLALKYLIYSI